MNGFNFKNGQWHADRVPLETIAKKAGTPAYVYSLSFFEERFREVDQAFKTVPHLVAFALKTNNNMSVLAHLAKLGAGADVVSGGEILMARKAGIPASRIIYSGVGKRDDEIAYGIREGIRFFNVESIPELEAIEQIAAKMGKSVPIAVRFNPDVDAKTHRYITTGKKGNKFGVSLEMLPELMEAVRRCPHLRWNAVHAHIGSQMTQTASMAKAVAVMGGLVEKLRHEGFPIHTLNMGGGYGIRYKDEKAPNAAQYAKTILPTVKKLNAQLVVEPGRFISGNSGVLLVKVLYVKKSGGKTFVITDGAMTELIRPPLYEAYHGVAPVSGSQKPVGKADIVGPVCESTDFFAKDRPFPEVKRGDILAVFSAGAYGAVMGSNYNARPFPPEVVVRGGRFAEARKRQMPQDLMARQRIVRLSSTV
jgi:diaminopimelate decarboxylase